MKWNNNSVLFVNPKKERTVIEDTSYTIDNCYNLSECFRIDNDEHYNSRDMNITDKFIQMVRFDKKPVPQPTKKTKSKGKPSTKKNISSSKKITLNDLSIKIQLSIISKYFFPEPSLINEYKEIIPREKYQKLISFYADSLQIYIRQHLISREYIKKTDKLEIYFTMDSEIQDVFDTDYEDVRSIFLTIMDESYPAQPMSHILAEQITGTYCKNILKCYEQVEDYLDYPQYVVQVHLYPEYMNFTLNAILPLDMNVESTKNETVLTLKREKIQFNMVDVFADALWDYIQSIEECPVKCCSKHQLSNYEEDIEMYHVFIKQFKLYITKQFTMNNKERTTDWHNPIDIPISSKCTCTCSITLADLFEVCITPAIDQLTSTIYASTIEKSISGNHKISHLVIMGTPFKLKCVNFTNHLLNLLKTTMDNTKQYSNPIPTHWVEDSIPNVIDQGMMSIINNPSGGLLEQISPGQYYLSFNKDATFHLLEWKKMEAYETGTAHIDNRERIDLNMRNDGYFRIFYINEENVTIYLYHKANEEHFSKAKCIEQYEYSRPDMYPVINRSVHGLGQVSFSFFTEHERVTPLDDTNICQIPIRDIILLSPFVLVE
ncbi:hypothetical protein BDB01DRAFT_478878 [Pilobolus umbonatus]|nr:hypothetical protein BDB01DRAFT_478878 [Pilobolus umbonatus]